MAKHVASTAFRSFEEVSPRTPSVATHPVSTSALTTTMLSLSIFTSSFSFGPGPVNLHSRVSDIYMYDAANPLKVRVIV